MQHVACPGCGAEVQFTSAASVMAVCSYCQTTVLKDAESVRDLGKMGVVLEDYSPLQIGSSGVYRQRAFACIGRIQLRYRDGFWNEWYVMFDDGQAGWLSDASGQYTMTFEKPAPAQLPAFTALKPAQNLTLAGQIYTAADVREAQCTAGQGELPIQVGAGWVAKVADFRCGAQFVTLDYSETQARLYVGEAVTLNSLQAQMLREADTIADASGQIKGQVGSLACPQCGHAVRYSPGATVSMVCPACQSSIDVSGPTAEVLAVGARLAAVSLSLELGASASIDGQAYTVLGALKRSALSDGSQWTEYLLYAPRAGFLWLIESSMGWERASVEDLWPQASGPRSVVLDQRTFELSADYAARVDAALGSFNWRVTVGDTVRVLEYSGGMEQLAAEISNTEMTWSRARRVPLDQLRAWFGAHVHAEVAPHPNYLTSAKQFLVLLAALDFLPFFMGGAFTALIVLVTAGLIYLPALVLDKMDDQSA